MKQSDLMLAVKAIEDLKSVRAMQKEIDSMEKAAKATLLTLFSLLNTTTIETTAGTAILAEIVRQNFNKDECKLFLVEKFGVAEGMKVFNSFMEATVYQKINLK